MANTYPFRIGAPRKPTVARCLLLLCLGLDFTVKAAAQELDRATTLTEGEVVALALRRAPLSEIVEGNVVAEQGRGRAAGAYPNPYLTYMREQTFGTLGTGEDYLTLSQTIDLSNRRGLQRDAGEVRAQASRLEGDAVKHLVATDARFRFYEVLYRQGRASAVENWVSRIDQALNIVTRREQRGDAATYDRKRLERERAVATGRLETERAALERVSARLQAILGVDAASLNVSGQLLPNAEPIVPSQLRASSATRPDLLALDLRSKAAELTHKAASRWWAPDLRFEGGWKGVEHGQQGRSDGFLLGASLALPLWDRSSGLALVAEGEARAARGRRALIESELGGELAGAHLEAVRLRRAAIEFREKTSNASRDLERIASAGYEGGELGLLELLDAYRGAADDAVATLDMELAARRARIELDRLSGIILP